LTIGNKIGIFDSGVGGLTVAKAICQAAPVSISYLGDTAHTPWGNQAAAAIQQYSISISNVLFNKGCDIIVIACNSASALAYQHVTSYLNSKAIVFNVIDPVAKHIAQKFSHKNVGIIGTRQTIHSKTYKKKIHNLNPTVQINELATAVLAPLIEDGLATSALGYQFVEHYLSNPLLADIDALVLGCTHYPLLLPTVKKYYENIGKEVEIIDSAQLIAKELITVLGEKIYKYIDPNHKNEFTLTSDSAFFKKIAHNFFGENIEFTASPHHTLEVSNL